MFENIKAWCKSLLYSFSKFYDETYKENVYAGLKQLVAKMFENIKAWCKSLPYSFNKFYDETYKENVYAGFTRLLADSWRDFWIDFWADLTNINVYKNFIIGTKNLIKFAIQYPYLIALNIILLLFRRIIRPFFNLIKMFIFENLFLLTTVIFNDVSALGFGLVKKLAKVLKLNIIVDICNFLHRILQKLFFCFLKTIVLLLRVKLELLSNIIDISQNITEYFLGNLYYIMVDLINVTLEVIIDVPVNIIEAGVSLISNVYAKITTMFLADNKPKDDASNDNTDLQNNSNDIPNTSRNENDNLLDSNNLWCYDIDTARNQVNEELIGQDSNVLPMRKLTFSR